MEDDQDQGPGSGGAPTSLLPYDQWMEEALRHVVVRALQHAAAEELPGGHHYYITFRTDAPGVVIPPRLREKYPEEMTIVLQHQYKHLVVEEEAGTFGVSLSFGGILSPLVVPFAAVSAFVDPHVQYGLRFRVNLPKAALPAPEPSPTVADEAAETSAPGDEPPQVVSLDAFRRRKD